MPERQKIAAVFMTVSIFLSGSSWYSEICVTVFWSSFFTVPALFPFHKFLWAEKRVDFICDTVIDMSEIPAPPGVVPPQKDEPIPFFRTVDFKKHPKLSVSISFVQELTRMIGDAADEEKNAKLAQEMEKMYGKKEAMDILEQVGSHLNQTIRRNAYTDTSVIADFPDRVKIARGIIGTPNWKDPNKLPPPIKFSIK